jgi:hypothetical protein
MLSGLLLPPIECGLFSKYDRFPSAHSAYWSIETMIAWTYGGQKERQEIQGCPEREVMGKVACYSLGKLAEVAVPPKQVEGIINQSVLFARGDFGLQL